ncbi:MAG: hypothetical protein ACYTG4_15285, partial [Planctomycetota bacterium]
MNSFACGQPLSSKPTENQFSGIFSTFTFGFASSPPTGPWKKFFAFHLVLVTVPSPNFRMKPPSPVLVLLYSIPVSGWPLSRAITAMVMGYSGRRSTETTLCGMNGIESTTARRPLMYITNQL